MAPKVRKLDRQIVGNVGLYFACYHLSLLGWNVMPTARNARGIDIVAYNLDGTRFLGLQVKTLSRQDDVMLGNSLDKVMGDFWIVVNNIATAPAAFIIKPEEVKELAICGGKVGDPLCWLRKKDYSADEFRNAWSRIGRGD